MTGLPDQDAPLGDDMPSDRDGPRTPEQSSETLERRDAQLLETVYEELRRRAARALAHLPPGQTLQPTALVHEAYAKLALGTAQTWTDEKHYLATATLAIRNVIVDRVRAKSSAKRGGNVRVESVDDALPIAMPNSPDHVVLAVDESLERLREIDARAAEALELRVFLGMTEAEAAAALGVSERTVRRDWVFARTWLLKEFGHTDLCVEE